MLCISTQLVEAEVDFSFENVIRVAADLDNMRRQQGAVIEASTLKYDLPARANLNCPLNKHKTSSRFPLSSFYTSVVSKL